MKINVACVKQEIGNSQVFHATIPSARFHEVMGANGEAAFVADSEVAVEGQVANSGRGLEITGSIRATIKHQCTRCLEDFTTFVEIPFSEFFKETDVHELDGEDYIAFQGDEIDITDLLRDSIILAEPLRAICSESCRGICPKCGTNLNVSSCSCERFSVDPRLAALEKLLDRN